MFPVRGSPPERTLTYPDIRRMVTLRVLFKAAEGFDPTLLVQPCREPPGLTSPHNSGRDSLRTILVTLALFGAVTCLFVLAIQFTNYRQEHSVAGIEAKQRLAHAVEAREILDARVAVLTADRCEAPVGALLALNRRQPIVQCRDFPERLASDIALCLKRDLIGPRFEDQLTDSGLMGFFA